ncbi:hypothetical protein GBAR_LOCUS29251 [Geodia barretti]|uniref:Uncharacterized protein n=2 Tax=Geodia barretti TaxID=519541 RepID=A0AA35TTL6_GEOBA|nr:hypothetical protein GBAR_LOCUS29251 [Geodia barretti]
MYWQHKDYESGSGGVSQGVGSVHHHRSGRRRAGDLHKTIPTGHWPCLEGNCLWRLEEQRLSPPAGGGLSGQEDKGGRVCHSLHATGRHQQGLRTHARRKEHSLGCNLLKCPPAPTTLQ